MPYVRRNTAEVSDYRENSRSAWRELLMCWDEMVENAGWIRGYSVLGMEMLNRVLTNRRTFDAITRRKELLKRLTGLSTADKIAEMEKKKARLIEQKHAIGAGTRSAIQRAIDDLSVSIRQVKYFAEYQKKRDMRAKLERKQGGKAK